MAVTKNKGVDAVPVVVFPLAGCAPDGVMTEEQVQAHLAQLRAKVRMHSENEGMKALVTLIEMRAAMKQRQACTPEGTAHDQGQAFGLDELLGVIRGIRHSEG